MRNSLCPSALTSATCFARTASSSGLYGPQPKAENLSGSARVSAAIDVSTTKPIIKRRIIIESPFCRLRFRARYARNRKRLANLSTQQISQHIVRRFIQRFQMLDLDHAIEHDLAQALEEPAWTPGAHQQEIAGTID